jgi:hypothetical protein
MRRVAATLRGEALANKRLQPTMPALPQEHVGGTRLCCLDTDEAGLRLNLGP